MKSTDDDHMLVAHTSRGETLQRSYASQSGLPELFKFRAFSTVQDVDRVGGILNDSKVYFALKSQLNDPFDLQPKIVLGGSTEDPAFVESLKADARRVLGRLGKGQAEIEHTILEYEREGFDQVATTGARRAIERIANAYPILSLAGDRTAPLLWSHYANGHSGLCIHFKTAEPSFFGFAQEVTYASTRAEIPVPMVMEQLEVHRRALLWKGEQWRYEREFRLIKYPHVHFRELGVDFRDQFMYFPLEWVTGVTLGIQMQAEKRARLLELAMRRNPPLPVWDAVPGDHFEPVFRAANILAAERDAEVRL